MKLSETHHPTFFAWVRNHREQVTAHNYGRVPTRAEIEAREAKKRAKAKPIQPGAGEDGKP